MAFPDRRTVNVLFTITLFTVALAIICVARSVLVIFTFSILFAYLIDPVVRFLQRHSLLFRNLRGPHVAEVYLCLLILIPLVIIWSRRVRFGKRQSSRSKYPYSLPAFQLVKSPRKSARNMAGAGNSGSSPVRFRQTPRDWAQSIRPELHILPENGRWKATPLLVALVVIEGVDIIFAADSIPAALSITRSTFIAYS